MGCNLPCDPECKKTLGNQGRPCMPAWGALGRRPWRSPMARRRASLAGAGMRLQRRALRRCSRKAATVWGWRGPSGTRAIDGTHALAAEDAGVSKTRATCARRRSDPSSVGVERPDMSRRFAHVIDRTAEFYQSSRAISSPGAASLPCAILEEGVSLPSPEAKATTLRCGSRLPALQCSPPQFGRARACGSATYLLPRSPAPSRSVRGYRWCAQGPP